MGLCELLSTTTLFCLAVAQVFCMWCVAKGRAECWMSPSWLPSFLGVLEGTELGRGSCAWRDGLLPSPAAGWPVLRRASLWVRWGETLFLREGGRWEEALYFFSAGLWLGYWFVCLRLIEFGAYITFTSPILRTILPPMTLLRWDVGSGLKAYLEPGCPCCRLTSLAYLRSLKLHDTVLTGLKSNYGCLARARYSLLSLKAAVLLSPKQEETEEVLVVSSGCGKKKFALQGNFTFLLSEART